MCVFLCIGVLFFKGKSTIAALVERFYDPQQGGIFLDGYPLEDLDPSWIRGQAIGYINQVTYCMCTCLLNCICSSSVNNMQCIEIGGKFYLTFQSALV